MKIKKIIATVGILILIASRAYCPTIGGGTIGYGMSYVGIPQVSGQTVTGATIYYTELIGPDGTPYSLDDYLAIDGGNANQEIDVGTYGFTADSITTNSVYLDGGMRIYDTGLDSYIDNDLRFLIVESVNTMYWKPNDTLIGEATQYGWRLYDDYTYRSGTGGDASMSFDGDSLNIIGNVITPTDDIEMTADNISLDSSGNLTLDGTITASTTTFAKTYIDGDLGKYGLGMKTASLSHCNRLVVIMYQVPPSISFHLYIG